MLTPRYRIGKKPEEEIPKIFKELGYPFMISKTAMYALGSPHTWPTILAALVWMVDLIKVPYLYPMQQVVTNWNWILGPPYTLCIVKCFYWKYINFGLKKTYLPIIFFQFGMRVGKSIDSFLFPPNEDEFDTLPESQVWFYEQNYNLYILTCQ